MFISRENADSSAGVESDINPVTRSMENSFGRSTISVKLDSFTLRYVFEGEVAIA